VIQSRVVAAGVMMSRFPKANAARFEVSGNSYMHADGQYTVNDMCRSGTTQRDVFATPLSCLFAARLVPG
jgi:hypothetical protein